MAMAIVLLVGLAYSSLLLYAACGEGHRFSAALTGLAINYGLRRLLFLDPWLGQSELAWYTLIIVADVFVVLVFFLGTVSGRSVPADCVTDYLVFALLALTLGLALLDPRVPWMVRFAHWKEEYGCLIFYFLVRQCGTAAGTRYGLPLFLVIAGLVWGGIQMVDGPGMLDLAWIESGRSVLARGGAVGVTGAHGLGNLEAGWLRPYAFFGNGTDMGVFMAFSWVLSRPRPGGVVEILVRTGLAALCAAGTVLTMVRFTWVVLAGAMLGSILGRLRSVLVRVLVLLLIGMVCVPSLEAIQAVALRWEHTHSLVGRVFVTGTYLQRWHAQVAWLDQVLHNPGVLLVGYGFGASGSAMTKFAPEQSPHAGDVYHHSRAMDLVEDGGMALLVLVIAILVSASRGSGRDALGQGMVSFAWSLMLASVFLGGKSVVLAALFWSALGLAVNRRCVVVPCA